MDLIQRNLVIVARKRFDGRIKACRMHDLLRDLCLKKARETNFLWQAHNNKVTYPSSSHDYRTNIQCRRCINYDFEEFDHVSFGSYSPVVVQSILCFNASDGSKYSNNVLNGLLFICETFKFLRVLDLCCAYGLFSRKLIELVNFRYLAITVGGSVQLPLSISNLSNLETLILFASMSEVTLSRNVWKIPKLRHLYTKGEKYSVSLSSAMDHSYPSILENLRTITNLNP
ncbi:hypothetical protein CsSME_00042926 [Camellia sinensis var. sinensis]